MVDSIRSLTPFIMVPPGEVKNPLSMLLLKGGLGPFLMHESFPKSVPGVVDEPLYFLSLYISYTALSNSSIWRSFSSSSYSRLMISASLLKRSYSFFFTSSSFFFMWSIFFFRAFSLNRMLTWGKLRRSSTLGLSLGSGFSIHFMVLINSSEYLGGILLNYPSLIFKASASWLSAVKGGLRAAIS